MPLLLLLLLKKKVNKSNEINKITIIFTCILYLKLRKTKIQHFETRVKCHWHRLSGGWFRPFFSFSLLIFIYLSIYFSYGRSLFPPYCNTLCEELFNRRKLTALLQRKSTNIMYFSLDILLHSGLEKHNDHCFSALLWCIFRSAVFAIAIITIDMLVHIQFTYALQCVEKSYFHIFL